MSTRSTRRHGPHHPRINGERLFFVQYEQVGVIKDGRPWNKTYEFQVAFDDGTCIWIDSDQTGDVVAVEETDASQPKEDVEEAKPLSLLASVLVPHPLSRSSYTPLTAATTARPHPPPPPPPMWQVSGEASHLAACRLNARLPAESLESGESLCGPRDMPGYNSGGSMCTTPERFYQIQKEAAARHAAAREEEAGEQFAKVMAVLQEMGKDTDFISVMRESFINESKRRHSGGGGSGGGGGVGYAGARRTAARRLQPAKTSTCPISSRAEPRTTRAAAAASGTTTVSTSATPSTTRAKYGSLRRTPLPPLLSSNTC